MKSVQLELEKIIKHLGEIIKFCEQRLISADTREEYVYFRGVLKAYKHDKEKCEGLLEVVTSVYPESRLEDIQK